MSYLELDTSHPVWDRFFTVAPLVLIGTVEEDGTLDLAPKHMVTPLGWDNYFGFVCTPRHATYRNALREGSFTVSYPRPDQLVHASLTASVRCDDGRKDALLGLPIVAAERVPGPVLVGAYLQLECELDRVVDGFGENGLVVGKVVAARVRRDAARSSDLEDERLLMKHPLLAYLPPRRFARIEGGHVFPLPDGFRR